MGNRDSLSNYNFKQGCWEQIFLIKKVTSNQKLEGNEMSVQIGRVCSRQRDSQVQTLRHKNIWAAQERQGHQCD